MNKRAWELEHELTRAARPQPAADQDAAWGGVSTFEEHNDGLLRMQWYSRVPGSQAPERLMVAAVQAMENRGMVVPDSDAILEDALSAYDRDDLASLNIAHMRLQTAIGQAEKAPDHPYWQFKQYASFEELRSDMVFPTLKPYAEDRDAYRERVYGGWLAQIIAGALGTAIEGYTTAALREAYGEIRDFVVEPSTFNDDVTYELAFLKALELRADAITSRDIAEQWVGLIPFGWSAELVALRNLWQGILPPESGTFRNPFSDWVGAQMRGAACGLVAPGDPALAAKLAWIDGVVSHAQNGVLGEVFNAVLASLGFVMSDAREALEAAITSIPEASEHGSVVRFALAQARRHEEWTGAWAACEERLMTYNWVHAYPNAAAEVIALWYGNGDFDETLHVNAMCGQDVDCSAAQALTLLGVMGGAEGIPARWKDRVGDRLKTYVRGMKELSIREVADWTVRCADRLSGAAGA
jgi:ADP-ribosylglycohydrolase